MEELMANLPRHIEIACQIVGAVAIVATIIVRVTPSKKDDESVMKIASGFWRIISYLPTIGINPQTKKLEDAYKEVAEKK